MSVVEDPVVFSEEENLLAVFGAVDIAVQDDPEDTGEARAKVAALLPYYGKHEVHWYRDFCGLGARGGSTSSTACRRGPEQISQCRRGVRAWPRAASSRSMSRRRRCRSLFAPDGEFGDKVRRLWSR